MTFLPHILLLVLLIAGYPIYQRIRERQLERKIEKAGNNKDLILSELDMHIEQTSKESEFFRKTSGRL